MAVVISNCNKSLEPSSLPSSGLFLDWHNLQNLVLQSRSDEHVNYLVLFDWERKQVDLLKALNFTILHKAPQLGNRNPIFLLLSSAPASSSSTTTSSTSVSKSSSESTTITGRSSIRHS